MKKYTSLLIALGFLSFGSLQSLTVINDPHNSFGSSAGNSFGQGLSNGFQQGMQNAIRQKEIELENQRIRRQQDYYDSWTKYYIENYNSEHHLHCVETVLKSDLPTNIKSMIINHFDSLKLLAHFEYKEKSK